MHTWMQKWVVPFYLKAQFCSTHDDKLTASFAVEGAAFWVIGQWVRGVHEGTCAREHA
jgi:hypothetical protein